MSKKFPVLLGFVSFLACVVSADVLATARMPHTAVQAIAAATKAKAAASAIEVKPGVKVYGAEIYLVRKNEDGSFSAEETRKLKVRTGNFYGWFLHVDTDQKKVTWREKLTLPKAPATWGPGMKKGDISADRKTATTTREEIPQGGSFSHFWGFADGDPLGKGSIQVEIEGKPVGIFPVEFVAE